MKKIHRFLIDTITDGAHFSIDDARLRKQIVSVLKLAIGEQIILFADGGDDIVCTITALHPQLEVERNSVIERPLPTSKITAAVCIPKSDGFERIVQKLTEIGISTIIPLRSTRTVKQSVRLDRLQTISDEALEQCGGSVRVTISEPMSLQECLSANTLPGILFDIDAPRLTTTEIKALSPNGRAIYYIGPEGGWDNSDQELFTNHDIARYSLGSRVLRTDTAAIIAGYKLWESLQ